MTGKAVHWFRQDLRLFDNPGFYEASKHGKVFPIYILDDQNSGKPILGAASCWWLHHSLTELNGRLDRKLSLFAGNSLDILTGLLRRHDIDHIYWNRCYEPWRLLSDRKIKKSLEDIGVVVETYNASLLWEPWTVLKKDHTPYKIFTPFYRKGCLKAAAPRLPIKKPLLPSLMKDHQSLSLSDLNLLPKIKWYNYMETLWQPGELGAQRQLKSFLHNGLKGYKGGRDFPSRKNVSRLSPSIRFGELSPNQVWYASKEIGKSNLCSDDLANFHSELGWREFSYNLLYHFKNLPQDNLQKKFDQFPWESNNCYLAAWKKGESGIPFVDAGMRELWRTGYIHNRVRMVVASFLVKNLLIHWREGERWFWDCLLDADLASNSASWQWVAGSGTDAIPYFRIFNPVLQGQRFDPKGIYTRQFVPELSDVPDKFLHNPWQAPEEALRRANVILGKDYPFPIVDLGESRDRALAAYSKISSKEQ